VYVPSGFQSEALGDAATKLTAAANARFNSSTDEGGAFVCSMVDPKSMRGEYVLKDTDRGAKAMRGQMLMYGAHARRAAGASEKVPECAKKWPDRYNPNGKSGTALIDAASTAVDDHTAALTALEVDLLPEAASTRRLLATTLDPDARFRVVEGSSESTGFSLSLTQGYVVSPHDDSGMALEMIGFV